MINLNLISPEQVERPTFPNRDQRFRGNSTYNLKSLWDAHHEIARLITCGLNNQAISHILGITPQTVSNVRNHPMIKQQIEYLKLRRDISTVDVQKTLQEMIPTALQVIEDVMQDERAKQTDKLKAAFDVLDRTGHGSIQKREVKDMHLIVTLDEIIEVKQAAKKNGLLAEEAVDFQSDECTVS